LAPAHPQLARRDDLYSGHTPNRYRHHQPFPDDAREVARTKAEIESLEALRKEALQYVERVEADHEQTQRDVVRYTDLQRQDVVPPPNDLKDGAGVIGRWGPGRNFQCLRSTRPHPSPTLWIIAQF